MKLADPPLSAREALKLIRAAKASPDLTVTGTLNVENIPVYSSYTVVFVRNMPALNRNHELLTGRNRGS